MNALNRFLRSAESRALAEHEARLGELASVRRLELLPDLPLTRADREAARPLFLKGHTPTKETLEAVMQAARGGLTPAQVAERFECSERTIFRVLKCARAAGRGR